MALLDFLKKKKEVEKSKKPVKKPAKSSVAKTPSSVPAEPVAKNTSAKNKNASFSFEAIKQPHISEKASYLAEQNQYIFEISPDYNKHEVKNAIEGLYKVDVLSVNMIKIPAKKRRLGKTEGFRKAYKKAVIKIKEGQKIEIL
jgi:large subunit ribosomal protein L23